MALASRVVFVVKRVPSFRARHSDPPPPTNLFFNCILIRGITVLCARWGLGLLRKWAADDSVFKALERPTPCEEEVRHRHGYPSRRRVQARFKMDKSRVHRQLCSRRCSNSTVNSNNSDNNDNKGLINTKECTRKDRGGDPEHCVCIDGGRWGSRTGGVSVCNCLGTDRPKTSGGLVVPYKKGRNAATAPGSSENGMPGVMTTAPTGSEAKREGCLRLAAPAGERGLSLAWISSNAVGDEISVDIFTPGVRVVRGTR